jgi:hypothetical protein
LPFAQTSRARASATKLLRHAEDGARLLGVDETRLQGGKSKLGIVGARKFGIAAAKEVDIDETEKVKAC